MSFSESERRTAPLLGAGVRENPIADALRFLLDSVVPAGRYFGWEVCSEMTEPNANRIWRRIALLSLLCSLVAPREGLAQVDLVVGQVATPDPVFAGGALAYTVTVSNLGLDAATKVVLADLLPDDVTWLSDDCDAGPPLGGPPGGVLLCEIGDLAPFGFAVVSITVAVSPHAIGTFENVAEVFAAEPDDDPLDNISVFESTVLTGVQIDSGSAKKVGVAPDTGGGDGKVNLKGTVRLGGAIDLSTATATVSMALAENEIGGAGELVSDLPLKLTVSAANETKVIYRTPGSERPKGRMEIRNRPRGSDDYQVRLRVDRIGIPTDPVLCAIPPADPDQPEQTLLTTQIVLDDGVNEPVTLQGTASYKCILDQDKVRVNRGGNGTTGGAPKASLKTELLTRVTGEPDDVELDASGSSDPDGTIVSYTFRVDDRDSGRTVFGPLTGTLDKVVATLAPGDYRAYVVIADDSGEQDGADRGFSVK